MTYKPVRDVGLLFDRQDMLEVMYRYCRAADAGDADAMVGCFNEPCAINLFADDEARLIRGGAALKALLGPLLGKVMAGSHYVTNPEFTHLGPDEAVLNCYMYSVQRFQPELAAPDRHRWGRYETRLMRVNGVWGIRDLRLFAVCEDGGDRIAEYNGRAFPADFSPGPVPAW